ncbi:MAG: DNA helicase II [Gammaproteobacteria bacterium RIFCSPLOWO2_02_FULL_38_11]|nr:MAG: DNA helicase II [Gammaproteobacteria bacterium RIFCSPHIGHO2_02_FULL_38_33]OGT24401.1 MAG: DNA helicase II [Gammaproteobacteria bacterium RIFCSPHIGHO2_12_38_15]OGT67992.1 MAG: DNA helicase II [Gammaproteobacteria bacterium RIFCSPLOWO2_02_FULL_38_11]OGT76629.1 MAG: DNA helicase II [Gammaproteobacteria bacterium RIFCSPLOWO2_12_FULL_38_14]
MEKDDFLDALNPAQREAVCATQQHLLVLAGAGSGKTRVLVHRIAWLLKTTPLHPYNILAVTFTNKAANEIRKRIENLLKASVQSMWVGTFHSLAHRLLRLHWQEAQLPQNFQILDADDQVRLVRRSIQSLQLDEERWTPRSVTNFINGKKESGLRPNQIQAHDPHTKTLKQVYETYETLRKQRGLVDFSELLLACVELLKNPNLLSHYQSRFTHVLVDEFQDTNTIQYHWIQQFMGAQNSLMTVGDDDQSIYGWRGAKVENIQRFSQDFPSAHTIRLEQNYRSTSTILSAANTLIANNDQRLGKNLWTAGESGEKISLYAAFNELDEANFVIEKIKQNLRAGYDRKQIAVLYRSNAQSRVLEENLIQAAVPYRVYGGLRFFERAEIKDALSYLRLLLNRNDDTAFERIINVPTRGIGEQTLGILRDQAKLNQISLWQAMLSTLKSQSLTTRAQTALERFHLLIESLTELLNSRSLPELTSAVIHQSGLIEHYQKEKGEKGQARIENLEELINALPVASNETTVQILTDFLSNAVLESGEYEAKAGDDCIQLMTLHAAKGLEFPVVFICGLEEGLFPHPMSLNEGNLEEERRLCYVGMTRAMKKLILTYSEIRRMHGQEHHHSPSRFLREIPTDLLDEVRPAKFTFPISMQKTEHSKNNFSHFNKKPEVAAVKIAGFHIGQTVRHAKFGEGVILNYEGQGPQTRIQIRFKKEGIKWLSLEFTQLIALT